MSLSYDRHLRVGEQSLALKSGEFISSAGNLRTAPFFDTSSPK